MNDKTKQLMGILLIGFLMTKLFPNLFPKEGVGEGGY